jgi:hypothetical protein
MRHRSKRFYGTPEQLDGIIRATGSVGHWEEMPAGYVRFKRSDGAILNWWPTGTFNFQGPPSAAKVFERELIQAVEQPRSRLPAPTSLGEG